MRGLCQIGKGIIETMRVVWLWCDGKGKCLENNDGMSREMVNKEKETR